MIGLRGFARRPLAFFADEDAAVSLLDVPDVQRVEGGSADRFAGAQVKAGMMPGTPDGAVSNETVDERSVVVAAVRIDGENLGPFAHQQNLLVAHMADQLAILECAGSTPCVRSGPLG